MSLVFLWYKDKSTPEIVHGNLDTYRFCRVPFGIICSPYLLQGTLQHHLPRQPPLGLPAIIHSDKGVQFDLRIFKQLCQSLDK